MYFQLFKFGFSISAKSNSREGWGDWCAWEFLISHKHLMEKELYCTLLQTMEQAIWNRIEQGCVFDV